MVTFDCGVARPPRRSRDQGQGRAASSSWSTTTCRTQRYGTINVIDADAAASGVLVRRLIAELGLPLTRDAAICLYAALVCDTGRFQYESTTSAVFELAEELAAFDLPIASSSRARCSRSTGSRTCSSSPTCCRRAELVPEKQFVWAKVTQADLAAARRHVRRGRGPDRPRAPHARGARCRAC